MGSTSLVPRQFLSHTSHIPELSSHSWPVPATWDSLDLSIPIMVERSVVQPRAGRDGPDDSL